MLTRRGFALALYEHAATHDDDGECRLVIGVSATESAGRVARLLNVHGIRLVRIKVSLYCERCGRVLFEYPKEKSREYQEGWRYVAPSGERS
jgi:hypothetical protein